MTMSRFFAFGCSFTNYGWPTWADILGSQFDEYQNWGRIGAGNQFITQSLVECHLKNHITANDVVGIMWTNVSRVDTYREHQWHTPGNIYTQSHYPEDLIRFMPDTRGFYMRDLSSIYMAKQLLDQLQCQFYMFSMVDITNPFQFEHADCHSEISDLLTYYKDTIETIRPSVHEIVFNYEWHSRPWLSEKKLAQLKKHYQDLSGPDWPEFETLFDEAALKSIKKNIMQEIFDLDRWDWKKLWQRHQRKDLHPTPLEHLEYLIKVLPERSISAATCELVKKIDDLIRNEKTMEPPLANNLMKSTPFERW